MVLSDLRSRAWGFLKDDGTHWPATEINSWLNDAQEDFAKRTRILQSADVLLVDTSKSPNTAFYKLPAKAFDAVKLEAGGITIYRTDPRELGTFIAGDWTAQSTSGTPKAFILGPYGTATDGRLLVRLFPYPTQALNNLVGYVARVPSAAMSADGDRPEIPDAHHMALVYYAVNRAYLKDFDLRDPQKAERFLVLYEEQVAQAAEASRGVLA
jgi:hypothetical protein